MVENTTSLGIDKIYVDNTEKLETWQLRLKNQATKICNKLAKIINKDLLYNVCFLKICSKHSNSTLVSLLRMFMKQTLSVQSRVSKVVAYHNDPQQLWTL